MSGLIPGIPIPVSHTSHWSQIVSLVLSTVSKEVDAELDSSCLSSLLVSTDIAVCWGSGSRLSYAGGLQLSGFLRCELSCKERFSKDTQTSPQSCSLHFAFTRLDGGGTTRTIIFTLPLFVNLIALLFKHDKHDHRANPQINNCLIRIEKSPSSNEKMDMTACTVQDT